MRERALAPMHVAAAAMAGTASWLTTGMIAVETGWSRARLGLLPAPWPSLLVAVPLVAAVLWFRRDAISRPLLLTALILLPWLPIPLPAAGLAWAGPLVWWVWGAVAMATTAALLAPHGGRRIRTMGPGRASVVAGALAAAIFACVWASSRLPPTGDEPHYLVIAQSLLRDRDLRVENNYAAGGHQAFYPGDLPPHFSAPARAGQRLSIHAPGLPVLVAPAFALGGYTGVVALLVLLAAFGTTLVWRAGFALTGDAAAAWFGWATVTLAAPVTLHGPTVYPDAVAGAIVAAAVLALVRRSSRSGQGGSLMLGVAIAALPWLHTRLVVLALVLAGLLAWQARERPWHRHHLASLLGPLAVGTAAWFWFFWSVYGTPNPSAPYGPGTPLSASGAPWRLLALAGDQEFGILPNAPVVAAGFAGFVSLFRQSPRTAIALTAIVLPYLLTVSSYDMWWGGQSAPARFAVPVLFALGAPAAVLWSRASARGRLLWATALGLSSLITATLAFGGGERTLRLNDATGRAHWLDWVAPLVDLPAAFPSAFRDAGSSLVWCCALWGAVALGTIAVVWLWDSRVDPAPPARALVAPLCAALGVMAGASVSWHDADSEPVRATGSQLALIRVAQHGDARVALAIDPPRLVSIEALLSRLAITSPPARDPVAEALSQPGTLLDLTAVPAGTYLVEVPARAAPWQLALRIGDGEPIERWTAPANAPGRRLVTLPLPVRTLRVSSEDRAAAPSGPVPAVALRPVAVRSPGPGMLTARSAARYGDLVVLATDQRVWLEHGGFWVMGASRPTLAVLPDAPRAAFTLLVRCGPVENRVRIATSEWATRLTLAPHEERQCAVPAAPGTAPTLITLEAARGFRPSHFAPDSRDHRLLGCWFEVR